MSYPWLSSLPESQWCPTYQGLPAVGYGWPLCSGDLLWEIQHSPFQQRHQHSLFGCHIQGFLFTYWMLEQVTACLKAAPWEQRGLNHSCLLQSTQQLSPGFPRGNHQCIIVPLLPGCPRVPA